MQEYFSQYIEEYEEQDVIEEHDEVKPVKEEIRLESLSDTVSFLKQERVRDIVVLDMSTTPNCPASYLIVCSPYSKRHGKVLAEKLKKIAKVSTSASTMSRRQTDNANGWICVEFGNTHVHVMEESLREHFDLDSLWGLDEGSEVENEEDYLPPS